MRTRLALSLAAGLALGLAACGSDGSTAPERVIAPISVSPDATLAPSGGGTVAPAAPGAATPDAVAVPAALDFAVPRVGGGTVDARTYAGRPVAFWFWAPG